MVKRPKEKKIAPAIPPSIRFAVAPRAISIPAIIIIILYYIIRRNAK